MKDKPVIVYYWYSRKLSEKTGLEHEQEIIYEELFPTIEKLLTLGLYVMLKEYENSYMIAIDDCPFRQR